MTAVTLLVSVTAALTIAVTAAHKQDAQSESEEWFNPGVAVGAPRNVGAFVSKIDAAFVGTLERVSVQFIGDNQRWLVTVFRFEPKEWIKSSRQFTGEVIEVVTPGGYYIVRNGRRVPTRPVQMAEGLQIGAEYFVPVVLEERPSAAWAGRYVLMGVDAFSRLDQRDVTPVVAQSTWPDAVLEQSVRTLPVPNQFPSRRELFLAILRAAAAAKR